MNPFFDSPNAIANLDAAAAAWAVSDSGARQFGVTLHRELADGVAFAAGDAPRLIVSGAKEHAPRRLADWLAGEARRDLEMRVSAHATALGLKARRITLRDQKSRWGSCSSDGRLSFSWRLILAPNKVLDYVAAHEVAHLREMNHSPRFWAHVKASYGDPSWAKKWLRENGQALMSVGLFPAG